MLNDQNPLRVVAECCGSCQFFINHKDGAWCLMRSDLNAANVESFYMKPYYVCSRHRASDLGSLAIQYDMRLLDFGQYSDGF